MGCVNSTPVKGSEHSTAAEILHASGMKLGRLSVQGTSECGVLDISPRRQFVNVPLADLMRPSLAC